MTAVSSCLLHYRAQVSGRSADGSASQRRASPIGEEHQSKLGFHPAAVYTLVAAHGPWTLVEQQLEPQALDEELSVGGRREE